MATSATFGPHDPPGTLVGGWNREFSLWGYTGSHSVVLFRSCKSDPDRDSRIDLVFKPVRLLDTRGFYSTLTVEVASEESARRAFDRLYPHDREDEEIRVFDLIGADGVRDQVACYAAGWQEDDGEWWEPSPFAADLSDGRTPAWRQRVLGGAPDGEMSAHYAAASDIPRGRFLYVVQGRPVGGTHFQALWAFSGRAEAEDRIGLEAAADGDEWEYRVETVAMDR